VEARGQVQRRGWSGRPGSRDASTLSTVRTIDGVAAHVVLVERAELGLPGGAVPRAVRPPSGVLGDQERTRPAKLWSTPPRP